MSLADEVREQGGKILHEGRTLRGVEAQVFRLALRAKAQRDAASAQQFAADVKILNLSGDVSGVKETPDGGVVLTFGVP